MGAVAAAEDGALQGRVEGACETAATAAISLLGPDAPAGIPGEAFTVTPGRYGAIPHTYVTCANYNAIPIALQRRFIEEINAISSTPTTVVELDSSHSPFLSQPAALATAIAELMIGMPRPGSR